jgi:tRNA (uracil-5-)-methyltransferase
MNQNNSVSPTNPCKYIGICGSCQLGNMNYEEQLHHKTKQHIENFSHLYRGEFEFFSSPALSFRSRAEFKLYHHDGGLSYAMVDINKNYLQIDKCEIVNGQIQTIMPKLLAKLNSDEILKRKVFMAEFITSEDEILVTLAYHKKLDEEWIAKAKTIENELNIKLIGRSRGQKIVLSEDFITHKFTINDNQFKIIQKEAAFSQPNRYMNTKMVSWILNNVESKGDLCELYCGGGNFTLPLSTKFEQVLATEISKASIASAKESCELNNINNIEFIRMSSEEFTSALKGEREFNRLKDVDLSKYSFSNFHIPSTINHQLSTIFVDPPRAGLDMGTTELVRNFDTIAYISCNPETLYRDLQSLSSTHKIVKFAFFDQFVWSEHIESGAILIRK